MEARTVAIVEGWFVNIRLFAGRLAIACIFSSASLGTRAAAVVDTFTLDFAFVLDGTYYANNNLAFGGIDFELRQDRAKIAEGHFREDVGGSGSANGVLAALPLATNAYGKLQTITGYSFHVPVTFARGAASTLEVYFKAGFIRGAIDFFSDGYGLRGTLHGLDDTLASADTTLWAKVTFGTSQPESIATPPDVAHAYFPDPEDPTLVTYIQALAQVTAPNALLIKVRPDGFTPVYDWAEASVKSALSVTNPVPLPAGLPLLAGAIGVCALRRRRAPADRG